MAQNKIQSELEKEEEAEEEEEEEATQEKKQVEFERLFKKNYPVWTGDLNSLIKWCRKKTGLKEVSEEEENIRYKTNIRLTKQVGIIRLMTGKEIKDFLKKYPKAKVEKKEVSEEEEEEEVIERGKDWKITKESCGCEFYHTWDEETGSSCCYLHKCRCKKHYEEQLVAEWYDNEGHHCIVREPEEVAGLVPLEKEGESK